MATPLTFEYDPQKIIPVIASFDTEGHVKPLYVRILGDSYKVLSHWCPMSNYTGIVEYNCKIAVRGYERPLLLKYYSREKIWTIPAQTIAAHSTPE